MKRHAVFILFVLSFALLTSSCRMADTSAASAPGTPDARNRSTKNVRLASSTEGRLAETIVVTGTLAAQDQITASVKVAGRVDAVMVDFGASVAQGQVLARLDPTDFHLRVEQAEAGLKQARARLGLDPDGTDEKVVADQTPLVRQARAQLEDAKLTAQRMQQLWDQKVIPKSQLDSALANLQVAESRYDDNLEEIRNRQGVLLQRKSELASAKQQLEDTTLSAPVAGVIRERMVSVGNYVSAGSPMFSIVMVHPLRLRLALPERGASGAKVGAPVRVTVEGDNTMYRGTLVRVSPSIQELGRTLMVEAEIPNERGTLRPGAFAKAEIVTSGEKPTVFVPAAAVLSFAGVEKVMSVKDGKAIEVHVTTGRRDGDRIEIVEGLKAGVPVVLDPGSLSPGETVNIEE
jgi:membrane fusion protein, multidrug efflux system